VDPASGVAVAATAAAASTTAAPTDVPADATVADLTPLSDVPVPVLPAMEVAWVAGEFRLGDIPEAVPPAKHCAQEAVSHGPGAGPGLHRGNSSRAVWW
jgi:hypothetical protein